MLEFGKICLSTLLSYIAIYVAAKLIGRKQISQLDVVDYISGITIGSIAAELATDLENMWKPLLALVLYALLTWLITWIVMRYPKSRKYLNGSPTIVMDNGKLYRENMKKAKLDLSEFMVMCRQQGYFDLTAIQTAVFEYNGKLTILPVSARRPVTPEDAGIATQQEYIAVEVIMDGRVLDENLQRMHLSLRWLEKRLRAQGIHSVGEVILGLCDRNGNLICYRDEKSRAVQN